MKIAFVHDYLNQYGGAERVLQVLCSLFPRAPIYTTVYDPDATGGVFEGRTIRTSFLQNMPLVKRYHHAFSFLMPLAVEQFDPSAFDVVFSISSSFAKGVVTKPHTRHVCYCLTPPRFLWDDSHRFVNEFRYPSFVKKAIPPMLSYLRMWDSQAAKRVDEFVAISNFVKDRIKKYYGRTADVLYPPVNTARFAPAQKPGDYFLMVGRIVSYKKFDLAIRVFNALGLPLKIAGAGIEADRLKKLAGKNVEFLGLVQDDILAGLYAGAKALVFPQEEDFGIVPLEAMASGRPVIAFRGGGAVETVIPGTTGLFFEEQTERSLFQALGRFKEMEFDPRACRIQAEKFDISVFQKHILEILTPPSQPLPL